MKKEIYDYLIEYGFILDNRKFLKNLIGLPTCVDGDLFKLDFNKHKEWYCSEVLINYYVYIPFQGYITIFKEVDSSYGYLLSSLNFNFDNLEQFKTVLLTVIF